MFWGIGIEHELMMIDANYKYNINGEILRKVLNLELYSDKNKNRIKKFINKKSDYTVFLSLPALIYKSRFSKIISQFTKNQQDMNGKYTKINQLFDQYVKLYSNTDVTRNDIINNELFRSIEDDSSINVSVPEFITPLSLITNNINSVCKEIILKEEIVKELQYLNDTPIVYPEFGYILPLDSEDYGKEDLEEQVKQGIGWPHLEIDYTGSYHFNLTLPYKDALILDEQNEYNKLCQEIDEYVDDILDIISFNNSGKTLLQRIHNWNDNSLRNLFISKIGGKSEYNKIFPISIETIDKKEIAEKNNIRKNMDLINHISSVYKSDDPTKIFEYIYAEYISVNNPIDNSSRRRLRLYLNFNQKLYALDDLHNPKLRAHLRNLHILIREIEQVKVDIDDKFKYFIRFTVNKDTNGISAVTPHCSFIVRDYITCDLDLSLINRQFYKSDEKIISGGPKWAKSSSKLKVIFDKYNYETKINYHNIALDLFHLTDIVLKQIIKQSTKNILKDVLDFYKLYIKYTKINFCKIHHEWACSIQWLSPLLLSAFGSCDPFSIGDNNKLSELSFRIFISGYNFVNMTNIRDLMLPTGNDNSNTNPRHTSKYQKKSRLEKIVVNTFEYDYDKITDKRKGEDRLHVANEFRVDTSKGFKFGFELRLFDHFPSIHCEVLLEFLFLLAEFIHDDTYSKTKGLPVGNPYDNLNYDKDILKILSQGWNQPFPKHYENFLIKNFGLEISSKCRYSRGGSRPYVYDVINDLYKQLQIRYINNVGKGKGRYVSYLIERNIDEYREKPIKILPNINRGSWTKAFNQFVWNLEPKTRIRFKIEKILEELRTKKSIHIGYLRRLIKVNLSRFYHMDVDDIIYALEDLNQLGGIKLKGIYYYNNRLRLP